MQIVLIGAGRLATHLGPALREAGHDIEQVYSRTLDAAETLAKKVGAEAVTTLDEVVTTADVYICALTDTALPALLPDLCKGREKALFLHTAGSMPLDVFRGKACRYGVLYPMQTFSKERRLNFAEIPVFIEADSDETLAVVNSIANSVSRHVTPLSSEARRHLHLSAVFACNFANHCYSLAADVLAEYGMPFEVLLPLIDETASKVHELSPHEAQTGPAVRYDKQVISRQADMLSGRMREVYELMSKSIHETSDK